MGVDTDRLVNAGKRDGEARQAAGGDRRRAAARGFRERARCRPGLRRALPLPPAPPFLPPGYAPTREELIVRRPGRKRPPQPGTSVDIVEILKRTRSALTARDVMAKLNLPVTRYASIRTILWQLVRNGRLKKDSVRGYRAP
jgi:hypothetical protein